MGLALADPMVAMIKVALERSSEREEEARTRGRDMSVVLHDYWRSSAAYRVRIALNLKGVAYERHDMSLIDGEQRTAENLARNPQGFVPTLEIDGHTITQSLAIIDYLDATLPRSAAGAARSRCARACAGARRW